MINVVDYVFLTGSLTLFFENSTRFALTFSDSLTSRIFARIDTAGGDICNAAFLLALAFAVLGNLYFLIFLKMTNDAGPNASKTLEKA